MRFQSTVGGTGAIYDAEPLPGEPDVFVAKDAPDGRYRVVTTEGWGMIYGDRSGAPVLRGPAHRPTAVRMGKPHSIYVAAANPGTVHGHVTEEWYADWKPLGERLDEKGFQRLEIAIERQNEGLVALRIPPAVWKKGNVLRVAGRFRSGAVSKMVSVQFTDSAFPDTPKITFLHPAPFAPLRVVFVPPPGVTQVEDGTPATMTYLDVPPTYATEVKSHRGVALFDALGSLGQDIHVAAAGGSYRLPDEWWRTVGVLYVIGQDPEATVPIELSKGGKMAKDAARPVAVRARFVGDTFFGRIPVRAQAGGGTTAHALPVPQEWLVRYSDGSWARGMAPTGEGATFEPAAWKPEAEARIQGKVRGGGLGYRVEFLLETRDPGDEAVLQARGAGLSASVSPYGKYEARLPPGRYEVRPIKPNGGRGRGVTVRLGPAQSARLDLDAPLSRPVPEAPLTPSPARE